MLLQAVKCIVLKMDGFEYFYYITVRWSADLQGCTILIDKFDDSFLRYSYDSIWKNVNGFKQRLNVNLQRFLCRFSLSGDHIFGFVKNNNLEGKEIRLCSSHTSHMISSKHGTEYCIFGTFRRRVSVGIVIHQGGINHMDNRHSAVDKAWISRGQRSCPHLTHTLPTAPQACRLPTSSTAATAAMKRQLFFFIYYERLNLNYA